MPFPIWIFITVKSQVLGWFTVGPSHLLYRPCNSPRHGRVIRPNRSIRGVSFNPQRSIKFSQKWPKKCGSIWKFHKYYPMFDILIPNQRVYLMWKRGSKRRHIPTDSDRRSDPHPHPTTPTPHPTRPQPPPTHTPPPPHPLHCNVPSRWLCSCQEWSLYHCASNMSGHLLKVTGHQQQQCWLYEHTTIK